MSGVPHGPEVDKTIRELARQAKTAQTELNRQAGTLVAKGHYEKAETLVAKAKTVDEFQARVRALREEWRQIRRDGRSAGQQRAQSTPLWEYYQPVLETLQAMGGRARRADLETEFESSHASVFKPGDTDVMAGNVPRWQKMIRRARKHLIEEGFIEDSSSPFWQITAEGKRAAKAQKPRGKEEKPG